VKRQNVLASFDLATPTMRAGVSRSAWAKGDIPVYAYPARGSTFHDWPVDSASPTDVSFELMVESRVSRSDSMVYIGEVKRVHDRWLVDSLDPSATFGGGAVVGPHDFTAQSGGGGKAVARVGSVWIALPAALIGAGVVFMFGWFLFAWMRNRRAAKRYKPRPLPGALLARESRESDA
jgi:hypothetical protein